MPHMGSRRQDGEARTLTNNQVAPFEVTANSIRCRLPSRCEAVMPTLGQDPLQDRDIGFHLTVDLDMHHPLINTF